MNEKGKTVMKMVIQMRNFYVEVSNFMKSFEKHIKKYKYKLCSSSTVWKDLSQSIDNPENWLPIWLYRIFENENDQDEILSLNIALYCPKYPERVEEPLAIVARVKEKNISKDYAWDAWDIYLYSEIKKRELKKVYSEKDLNLNTYDIEREWTKEEIDKIEMIRLLAVPLLEIENEEAILEKIIKPILCAERGRS